MLAKPHSTSNESSWLAGVHRCEWRFERFLSKLSLVLGSFSTGSTSRKPESCPATVVPEGQLWEAMLDDVPLRRSYLAACSAFCAWRPSEALTPRVDKPYWVCVGAGQWSVRSPSGRGCSPLSEPAAPRKTRWLRNRRPSLLEELRWTSLASATRSHPLSQASTWAPDQGSPSKFFSESLHRRCLRRLLLRQGHLRAMVHLS